MTLLCLSLHLEAPIVFLYHSGLGIRFPTRIQFLRWFWTLVGRVHFPSVIRLYCSRCLLCDSVYQAHREKRWFLPLKSNCPDRLAYWCIIGEFLKILLMNTCWIIKNKNQHYNIVSSNRFRGFSWRHPVMTIYAVFRLLGMLDAGALRWLSKVTSGGR